MPVLIPVPQPAVLPFAHGPPARLAARGTFGMAKPKSQPRFVFSMPYSAAGGLLRTPGGKWMPLMNRTVRDDSGAWSLEKNAPVRARPTA